MKKIFKDEDSFAKYISNATTDTLNNFFRNGNFIIGKNYFSYFILEDYSELY